MSTSTPDTTPDVALPYAEGTLIEVHFNNDEVWDTEPDVRLAIVELVDDDSLTARIIAEWFDWNPRHIDFDARGISWTLYAKQIADGTATVRVVQPEALDG